MLRQLVSVSAHRIGQLPGPIDQHSAAIASHAAASGQQIKQWFPQVPWKIGDRHVVWCFPWPFGCFKLFQTG